MMLIGIMMIILTAGFDDACLMIIIMMFVTVPVITIDFDECIFSQGVDVDCYCGSDRW